MVGAVVILVVVLIINYLFANEMQEISEKKGAQKRYWAWCFWIPLYGFMLVNTLPDRGENQQKDNTQKVQMKEKKDSIENELPEL